MSSQTHFGPHQPKGSTGFCLPGFVAQQYYRHGLFCASHPRLVLFFTVIGVLWTCLPLISLPIYSGEAQIFTEKEMNFVFSSSAPWMRHNVTSVAFVLPIVMKAVVHPYKKDELIRTDAFRAPLASAFKLHLDDIGAFRSDKLSTNMESECWRMDGISKRYRSQSLLKILPEFGCLVLSPANLWQRNPFNFQMDANVVSTVFNYQKSSESHSSVADLVFAMRQRETGLTKYPIRNRQRVITYGVTVVLKRYDKKFVDGLEKHLKTIYPHSTGNVTNQSVVHMYFPTRSYTSEVLPFFITLLIMFLYVYFSCKKIDLVYSKIGIAFCSMITVLFSILLSLSLSGLTLNMSSKMCVMPYLVAFISLENLMVITRSVVTTQAHLDVKIRVAKGLSREGWNITKILFTEISILTLGFFIGFLDPSIQDFCLLLVMGLLSDFFLQTFFFTSVLALDMSRMELSDIAKKPTYRKRDIFQFPISGPGIKKTSFDRQTSVMAPQCSQLVKQRESKRVKFINFWAKRRIVQRLFSLCMIVWISLFVYQSSLLEVVFKGSENPYIIMEQEQNSLAANEATTQDRFPTSPNFTLSTLLSDLDYGDNIKDPDKPVTNKKLLHVEGSKPHWRRLPHTHWPLLFDIYNVSLFGKYLTVLPTIHLSMNISPDSAKQLRHPEEEAQVQNEPAIYHSFEGLQTVLELNEDSDFDEEEDGSHHGSDNGFELNPFVPTTPGELFLAFLLALPSVVFLVYLLIVVYRCVCSRNYAEWRSSWNTNDSRGIGDIYTQIVQESVPIVVDGHEQEIESLVTNDIDNLIVTLSLEGTIAVWDSYTGERINTIKREDDAKLIPATNFVSTIDDYGLSPSMKLNLNFSTRKFRSNNITRPFHAKASPNTQNFSTLHTHTVKEKSSMVWAMDCVDDLLILGCSDGKLELWNAREGNLITSDLGHANGVTHLKLVDNRVVVGRLSGSMDFFMLESKSDPCDISSNTFSNSSNNFSEESNSLPFKRSHVRSKSTSHVIDHSNKVFVLLKSARVHQQPITCLEFGGGNVLTGSMDHTIHVFRLEELFNIFTLHGHQGPITTAFIDPLMTNSAGSGSQDGMVCVWDLLTGACVYSIFAHDGAVLSLTHSPSYVISLGADGKLCVWERFQGHLINSILMIGDYFSFNLTMLTHNLMVTSSKDSLVVWDARLPDPVKIIRLGDANDTSKVTILKHFGDTVACNYGKKLCIVHFPLLSDKND